MSVIVPCAGTGSRFGAAYPKELHCVEPGVAVIDLAMAPVLGFARQGRGVRLVVVLGPHKLATAEYLHRYANEFDEVFVYQAPRHGPGLSGAIRAALPVCVGDVALWLPDQILGGRGADGALHRAVEALAGNEWVVIASMVEEPRVLAQEGALRIDCTGCSPTVGDAEDKPMRTERFNAAWAAVVVRRASAGRLVDVLDGSVPSPLVGAAAVVVDSFDNVTRPGGRDVA